MILFEYAHNLAYAMTVLIALAIWVALGFPLLHGD
jgi:hypothetical protein